MSISELFEDMIARPAQQTQQAQIDPALQLAQLVGKPGAFAAFYGNQRNEAMANAGRNISDAMSGGQYSSGVKITPDQIPAMAMQQMSELMKGDTNDPATQSKLIALAQAVSPQDALKLSTAFNEQNKTQQGVRVVTEQLTELGYPEVAVAVESGAITPEKGMEMVSPNTRASIAHNERMLELEAQRVEGALTHNEYLRAKADLERVDAQRRFGQEDRRLDQVDVQLANSQNQFRAGEEAIAAELQSTIREETVVTRNLISLANDFESAGIPKGLVQAGQKKFKDMFGTQENEDLIRQTYIGLKNKYTMGSLPPGAASDVDVANALKTWPGDNADPEYIASWLKGVAKLQAMDTAIKNEEVRFLNQYKGSAGTDADGNTFTFYDKLPDIMADPAFIARMERSSGLSFAKEGDANYMDNAARVELNEGRSWYENTFLSPDGPSSLQSSKNPQGRSN